MAHEIGNVGFHQGFQQPTSGAREVDLRARQIQEAAKRLSVSVLVGEKNLLIYLSLK